jgi:dienelactone hydrolase
MNIQSRIGAVTVAFIALLASNARAAVQVKEVEYQADGKPMLGYLAWDDASNDKRPGILIFPEWWGNNDYPKMRAQKLAELGYVAFAADMYGKGKVTDDPKQAGAWAGEVKNNPELVKQRAAAALDQLKQQPQVDPAKIGAIGYCFGGTCALTLAATNFDDLKGVVSFHGGLDGIPKPEQPVKAKVLVCNGAADQFVPEKQVKQFEKGMKNAGADVRVIDYPGAHHAFTNPDADRHKIPNIEYNRAADEKSWQDMKQFFGDLFK